MIPTSPTILFEHTCFCAIEPAQRDAYAAVQAARWLKPGGQFLAVHYMLPPDEDDLRFGTSTRGEDLGERFGQASPLNRQGTGNPRSWEHRQGERVDVSLGVGFRLAPSLEKPFLFLVCVVCKRFLSLAAAVLSPCRTQWCPDH